MNSGLTAALTSAPLRTAAARRMLGGSVLLAVAGRGAIVASAVGPGAFTDTATLGWAGSQRYLRGANAVDLQQSHNLITKIASGVCSTISGGSSNTASALFSTVGGGTGNTASGSNSTVCGGLANTANGTASVAGGSQCTASNSAAVAFGSGNTVSGAYGVALGQNTTASSSNSFACGSRSVANRIGQFAIANGMFAAVGDAQRASISLRMNTAATTQVELTADGGAVAGASVTTANRFILEANTTIAVDAYISWRDSAGLSGFAHRRCLIKRDAANNTVLVGSVQTIGTDFDETGGAAVTLAADNTNEALQVLVTPFTTTATRWHAELQYRIIGH